MLVLNASTFGTTHWTLITARGTTTPPSASPPSAATSMPLRPPHRGASPLLVWRAMPRDRRLPLWGVLCRCLTALQTTRRRASGSAHVLPHRLYPLQAKRLHILLFFDRRRARSMRPAPPAVIHHRPAAPAPGAVRVDLKAELRGRGAAARARRSGESRSRRAQGCSSRSRSRSPRSSGATRR